MNIRQMLRKSLLNEGKNSSAYDYGCVMVYLDISSKEWKKVQDIINEDNLYSDDESKQTFGRETEPHVTILFGLHSDVPDEDVEKIIDEIATPEIKIKGASIFQNELYDVLKFDIDSPELHEYNKQLKELPHTSNFPKYHPHMTIAYVKPNTGKEYADKINKLGEISVKPSKIVYSKPNGAKKNYTL